MSACVATCPEGNTVVIIPQTWTGAATTSFANINPMVTYWRWPDQSLTGSAWLSATLPTNTVSNVFWPAWSSNHITSSAVPQVLWQPHRDLTPAEHEAYRAADAARQVQLEQRLAADSARGIVVLNRSAALFRRLRGQPDFDAFMAGRPIILRGCRHDYRVSKTTDPLRNAMHPDTHTIPYRLEVLDRDGRVVTTGCVVIPRTPLLDQILAVALHVADEDAERDFLRTTNWSISQGPRHLESARPRREFPPLERLRLAA